MNSIGASLGFYIKGQQQKDKGNTSKTLQLGPGVHVCVNMYYIIAYLHASVLNLVFSSSCPPAPLPRAPPTQPNQESQCTPRNPNANPTRHSLAISR